jgi:predicted nucleotidyltransferase component of viral defense system
MISDKSYSKEWIESFRKQQEYKTVNPPIFEKMIYAFSLLEMLAKSEVNFIFKGGTSLLLMPIQSDRFSIDIDIITQNNREELEVFIQKSMLDSAFTSFREDEKRRDAGGVPKAHYIFNFNTNYSKEGNILLDVLFVNNPYPSTTKVDVKCNWIFTEEPYPMVTIPSINAILGDKLTAFAPKTTGIPYWLNNPQSSDKRMEIIKQLYDVSNLINYCDNISETKMSFNTIAKHQIKYRNLTITENDVIDDIFDTALVLAKRNKNKTEPNISYFRDLQSGIIKFESYLIKSNFKIEDAIAASAKVACFTQHLKTSENTTFEKFDENSDVFKLEISNTEFNFLNRLKKTNKQAYFYWYKCLLLMNLIN